MIKAPQAIKSGVRISPEKEICGTLSRIRAGREMYRANMLSTRTVSGGKASNRLKIIPRITKKAISTKFSISCTVQSLKQQGLLTDQILFISICLRKTAQTDPGFHLATLSPKRDVLPISNFVISC